MLAVIQAQGIKVHEIFCFDNYWSIVIADNMDLEHVPRALVGQACCYRFESEICNSDYVTLQTKVPKGINFNNTNYYTIPDALLRPSIVVISLVLITTDNGQLINMYKKITSGILVVNKDGEPFTIVVTHGFEADGLVYHPNPIMGSVIS